MLQDGDLVSGAYMLNNLAYLEVTLYSNPHAATDLCQRALDHLATPVCPAAGRSFFDGAAAKTVPAHGD